MEVTLEMIEDLRKKTGASYHEARQALESSEGDMVEALKHLQEDRAPGEAITCSIQEVYHRWKDTRLEVRVGPRSRFSFPVIVGALAAAAFPRYTLWGVLGLMLARGTLGVKHRDRIKGEYPEHGDE